MVRKVLSIALTVIVYAALAVVFLKLFWPLLLLLVVVGAWTYFRMRRNLRKMRAAFAAQAPGTQSFGGRGTGYGDYADVVDTTVSTPSSSQPADGYREIGR
ncbi:hypothetical protein [Bifidobacterium choloepi]|uniref:Uncharacterized protein n=1 Tax=Bifidobacterium choloepi TaxID=2614131 RepID=A0A6I5NFS2_9BIFI|nr:hypothetical protein [Bifidobacterium choloepi]NEG69203.1 hypothetical protein [Bifidobacterium choloepi]